MKKTRKICACCLIVLAVIHLISAAFSVNSLAFTALMGALILFTSIPVMNRSFRLPTLIFFILGSALLLYWGQGVVDWMRGINTLLRLASPR